MSVFGQRLSHPDSQQLLHIHGVYPPNQDREVCVDVSAIKYMWCVCFSDV